jgi:hypothetical protein
MDQSMWEDVHEPSEEEIATGRRLQAEAKARWDALTPEQKAKKEEERQARFRAHSEFYERLGLRLIVPTTIPQTELIVQPMVEPQGLVFAMRARYNWEIQKGETDEKPV